MTFSNSIVSSQVLCNISILFINLALMFNSSSRYTVLGFQFIKKSHPHTRSAPFFSSSTTCPIASIAFSSAKRPSTHQCCFRTAQKNTFVQKSATSCRLHTQDFMDLGFDNGYGCLGEKYSMVELPDSLMDTTIFVGNLNDFVTDEILSDLFQEASTLNSVPSVVARKPNCNSLNYGFVTFPTVSEKEAAIVRFHGYTLQGKQIKVESIKKDGPRVRVPEGLVLYTVGKVKKIRKGQTNTLRRISKDDVVRLSRGQPAKKKGYGSRGVCHRLNDLERSAFERAERSGFVTLEGTGYRRGRKGSPLGNIHRQWCDARAKPQIILCKASGGRPLDNIIVDLSPLRISALSEDSSVVDDFLSDWKTQILKTAEKTGMFLKKDYEEDNTKTLSLDEGDQENENDIFSITVDQSSWASDPIWRLPAVSIGVFEGERANAKKMAKELAVLWETMDINVGMEKGGPKNRRNAGQRKGGRTKTNTLSQKRRRANRY